MQFGDIAVVPYETASWNVHMVCRDNMTNQSYPEEELGTKDAIRRADPEADAAAAAVRGSRSESLGVFQTHDSRIMPFGSKLTRLAVRSEPVIKEESTGPVSQARVWSRT